MDAPPASASRILVVVADDLGRSPGVNRGIAEAHDRGIVTAASLMAGGEAFEEAIALCRERPRLSTGLHLTLCDGKAVLPRARIPDLVDGEGRFEASPSRAGLRYWRERARLREQLRAEIEAQLDRLEVAGVRARHLDGHHHLHVHPVIFDLACELAPRRGIRWVRLPRERAGRALRPGPGLLRRAAEWATFAALGRRDRRRAEERGLSAAARVFGLSDTGRLDEAAVLAIADSLPGGISELFAHPDHGTETGWREIAALTSERVRRRLEEAGVVLRGYGELEPGAAGRR